MKFRYLLIIISILLIPSFGYAFYLPPDEVFDKMLPTIFVDVPRKGQERTYQLLIDLLKQSSRDYNVVRFANYREFKAGDTVLINLYSKDFFNSKLLWELNKKGVNVVLDFEATRIHDTIQYDVEYLINGPFTKIITSSDLIARELTAHKIKGVQVARHLESLYMKFLLPKEVSPTEHFIESLSTDKKMRRILFVEQYDMFGEMALKNFIEIYSRVKQHNDEIIIALHPYSGLYKYSNFISRYPNLNIKIFISSADIKTTALFPYVDGVISVASTLVDVAKQVGIPSYTSITFKDLDSFIDDLDPTTREIRRKHLSPIGEETLLEWRGLLTSEMGKLNWQPILSEETKRNNCSYLLEKIVHFTTLRSK